MLASVIATEDLRSACWRTRTYVQQRDSQFPPGERLVDDGHVADHQRQKAEPQRHLGHHQQADYPWHRGDITQAKGEKPGSARVQIVEEADLLSRRIRGS